MGLFKVDGRAEISQYVVGGLSQPASWDIRDDTGADIKNNQNGWALSGTRDPYTSEESPAGYWHAAAGGNGDFEAYVQKYNTTSGITGKTKWTCDIEIRLESLDTYAAATDGCFYIDFFTGAKRVTVRVFDDKIICIDESASWAVVCNHSPSYGTLVTYRLTVDLVSNVMNIYKDEVLIGTSNDCYDTLAANDNRMYFTCRDDKGDANTTEWYLKSLKVATGIYE